MQDAYKAAPDGPLKVLDRAKDGVLDEIDRIGISNKPVSYTHLTLPTIYSV